MRAKASSAGDVVGLEKSSEDKLEALRERLRKKIESSRSARKAAESAETVRDAKEWRGALEKGGEARSGARKRRTRRCRRRERARRSARARKERTMVVTRRSRRTIWRSDASRWMTSS